MTTTPNHIPRWKKLNTLAHPNEQSRYIFAHLSEYQRAIMALDALVTPVFQKHASMNVRVVQFEQGILTIATESLTAANHLQYLNSLFIPELKQLPELVELTSISFICIDMPQPRHTCTPAKPHVIDDESCEILEKSASMIRNNPELSHALRQLSNKK